MALCVLLCVSAFVSLAPNASAQPATSNTNVGNGVDVFRGAWGGTLTAPTVEVQINLYFTSCVAVSVENGQYKASGYFTYDPVGGPKRASTQALPMIAFIQQIDNKHYDLTIFANVITGESQPAQIIKLTGQASFGKNAVTDDSINGNLVTNDAAGIVVAEFSLTHLDRRNISPTQLVVPQPSLDFICKIGVSFDCYGYVPGEDRVPHYAFDFLSNIVMDSAKVIFPDGTTLILKPYSDIFTPGVNWITSFRFHYYLNGLPIQDQPYTFIALDVEGNPIPGVTGTVTWTGIAPPDPPQNIQAQPTSEGLLLTWSAVNVIPNSFDPEAGIGFYQIVLNNQETWVMTYGAIVQQPYHIIPYNQGDMTEQDLGIALSQMPDGVYSFMVNAWTKEPNGSGCYSESNDWSQAVYIRITEGTVQVLT